MQTAKQHPGKRSRYYHSQIDMEMLLNGMPYEQLSDSYVIFICDYDPFGLKKYRYTFDAICHEDCNLLLNDGSHTIILSTQGENHTEVSRELVQFLKFVKANLKESERNFEDSFVSRLQEIVSRIKKSREMEERYMIFEEMLRDERIQGKAEGKSEAILELLEELGTIPDSLRADIMGKKDLSELSRLHKLAAKAETIEQFLESNFFL